MSKALESGLKVALIDRPPIGGTCMNFGCLPSKTLLYRADRIGLIRRGEQIGIKAGDIQKDFSGLMDTVRNERDSRRKLHRKQVEGVDNLDFYKGEASFISPEIIDVEGSRLSADKIFIANGARPLVPPIEGLDKIGYLTNETVLELKEKPGSIVLVGGGYIALEYAYFFSSYDIDVTIIEMNSSIMGMMEPEISELMERELRKYATLHLNSVAEKISGEKGNLTVHVRSGEDENVISAQEVFVAAGRTSNADTLSLENTQIDTDDRGYISVDEFMETTQPGVYAFGDVIGKFMFKHVANEEARKAWNNAVSRERRKMDYHACPMAVYGYPEIASVGLTEEKASRKNDILIGKSEYESVSRGNIMRDHTGFVKAVVERDSRRLLGFHAIGPHASIIVQEAVNVIANNEKVDFIINSMHTFPSLSEIVIKPMLNLKEV